MVVRLQDEFSSQLHAVPQLVHLIDQHCIEVFILENRGREAAMTLHMQENESKHRRMLNVFYSESHTSVSICSTD